MLTDTRDKIIAVLAGVIVLLAGAGLGWFGEYHFAVQLPRTRERAAIARQQEQLRRETRSGTVVAFNTGTVTVAVTAGGADAGKTATYNVTRFTNVQRNYAMVSRYGRRPDLAALGLKAGCHVNLLVNGDKVVDLQFNSGSPTVR